MTKNKKIIVVGSGTSGLIVAMMLKTRFENFEIEIISSEKIGIIGVGEATTEHLKRFLKYVDIPVKDLIENTDATIKLYIKFVNWGKKDFYHNVGPFEIQELNKYFYNQAAVIKENLSKEFIISDPAYIYGKVDSYFVEKDNGDVSNQYNFDTFKLNKYLINFAKKMNIKFYDDIIDDVFFDEKGFVSYLKGKKNNYIGDIFIDASGFNRTIIKKIEEIKWISYKKFLPLDRAFVFQDDLPENFEFLLCATARALKYGWNFQVPTQVRTGNGYIYSKDYVQDEEAVNEISQIYNKKIKPVKFFDLNSGRLNKFWHKNIVAIGISSGFVEPLEATAISATVQQTFLFFDYLASEDRDAFNIHSEKLFENIVDFLQLHYYVDKKNSKFWIDIKNNLTWREKVISNIKIAQKRLLNMDDFENSARNLLFGPCNWNCILFGLDLFNIENIKKEFDTMVPKWFIPEINKILDFKKNYNKRNLIKEKEIIKRIKQCH